MLTANEGSLRIRALMDAFVAMTGTLSGEAYDLHDFLHELADRCLDLFGVDQVGMVVSDIQGRLMVIASTSHDAHALELLQLDADQGPCITSFQEGIPVVVPDVQSEEAAAAWPSFSETAAVVGIQSVVAIPMRAGGECIGTVNLFSRRKSLLDEESMVAAQALCDFAAMGIVQERARASAQLLAEQLQAALDSRVMIEQAKGMIAESLTIPPGDAFELLRAHSRSRGKRLREVAERIVTRELQPFSLLGSHDRQGTPAP